MKRSSMRLALNIFVMIGFCSPVGAWANGAYFSDDSISYRYGTAFKEPATAGGGDIIKNIVNYNHFNTDRLGSNFLDIDAAFSHDNDPKKSATSGATEVYLVYRRDFSLHALTGLDVSDTGVLRDIALHMGGDLNTKDNACAPQKKLLVIGPELQFALPRGHFNLAFDYSQEWNHNGIVDKAVRFDPAFEIEANWGIPFQLGETSWKFSGFFTYVAPKGRDGFGAETKAEILARPELMLDVGDLIMQQKNVLEVGAGYEYWRNKFGNDHTTVSGSFARTPELIVRMHF